MKQIMRRVLACLAVIALVGCTAMTTMTVSQPDVAVSIRDKSYGAAPISDSFATTSFGNYEFKATKAGQEPFYGILPLSFNGGYLALDILFFAPAAFFNLREVYPYYHVEFDKRVVLFKKNEKDEWREFKPSQAEALRAQIYFETKKP